MQIYLAAPLFSQAERDWLDRLAETLRGEGFECFVPHEHFDDIAELTPDEIYRVDGNGLRASNVLLAWLDGPMVDDGTAAEIGAFAELCRTDRDRYRGMIGLVTDLRLERRRGNAPGDGINLFVAGAIVSAGSICWSVEEAIDALHRLTR
ncbi:MAG TPA: nucleoside 2-deoxyribosyltransferase [Gaiellaceae bacterium]|nr:nucleoside 2-deoxyribosyltransferase [Gaiellaceae bacterium]